jgi:pilus assembly protein CpaB
VNNRLMTILALALVIASGTSYVVYQLVRSRMAAVPASNQIVIAARTLDIGTLIKESDLSVGTWVGTLPKGFARSPKELIGRGVVSTVYDGEPVTENRLALPGGGAGLAATIPNGMRACAVRVNEVVGVAGFVVPGMRVDVLISGTSASSQGGPRVKTLLQNVEVLSAGQNYQKDAEGKPVQVPVVNLLVTPEQAEILSLASNETRIQLVLRNPLDNELSKTTGSAMDDLFGEPKRAPVSAPVPMKVRAPSPVIPQPAPIAAAPPPQPQLVEVLNGPKKSQASFSKTEEQ